MINLFGKIFIGFWLALLVVIASWMLAGSYFSDWDEHKLENLPPDALAPGAHPAGKRPPAGRPPGAHPPARSGPSAPLPRHIYRIYYGLQNVEGEELQRWITQQETEQRLSIYLVKPDGTDYFSRQLNEATQDVAAKVKGFRRRAVMRSDGAVLFAHRLSRPDTQELVMVIVTHPPRSALVRYLTEQLWLRLLLALLVTGLISYFASRYLTRPLKDLQKASRKLAAGELDTRIVVPQRGGDEAAELGRAFNTMAEQLEEKIELQKQLLTDVSHELRSPLARLRVALALAEQEPSQSREYLRRMERETQRLDELIGQLLTLPDKKIELEDSIDLVVLLETLCQDARFEAQARGQSVDLKCSIAEAIISTHADLLIKALENVIRNALHYSPNDGAVKVLLTQTEASYQLSVQDSGIGVAEADLEKIFQPFYRTDSARQRETGGHGLGLAIASRAVAQHGGSIRARNTATGLCVDIELPRVAPL